MVSSLIENAESFHADSLPMTGTGKIHKLTLREQFKDYVLPHKQHARGQARTAS